MRFVIASPATVANMGPGFDALAYALEWRNEIIVEDADSLLIEVEGEGADDIARDATNLVVRAMAGVLGSEPRVKISLRNTVPFGRGFGSSATAIVGGSLAGFALLGKDTDPDALIERATAIEGHADNVSACVLGGITVSLAGTRTARLAPPHGIVPLAIVADAPLDTQAARAALPEQVTFADAAATAGRAARLTAALAIGDVAALLAATEDDVHQPARFALAPTTAEIVAALRAEGIAAFLSGAGPSVGALVAEDGADVALAFALEIAPKGWSARLASFASTGAIITRLD